MKERFGIKTSFDGKQFGQFRNLLNALGDLTPDVTDWMIDPINWRHFCQQVRADLKVYFVPVNPEVGFLLKYQGVGLRLMHGNLRESPEWADFIQRLEKNKFDQYRNLALVYAVGDSNKLAKIAASKTLNEIEAILAEMMCDELPKSA